MRRLGVAILLSSLGWAQSLVNPQDMPRVMTRFEPHTDDRPLACTVTTYGPALNFSFRLQAGYVVRMPLRQFAGPRHAWFTLIRVSPEAGEGKPVFLATKTRLPDVPPSSLEAETGGGYLLGEGAYQVRLILLDDQGRVCRKERRIDARLKPGERPARSSMRPNSVAPFSLFGAPDQPYTRDDRPAFSVSILMNAAPIAPRRTHFRTADRMLLVGSLAALLERIPARSVRLVLFSLDRQKELYRKDDFTVDYMDQVEQALSELELDSVDYAVLQKPKGHVDLLAELVNRELRDGNPSDAVVFLGPSARYGDRVPRGALDRIAAIPRFFYFQYHPLFRRAAPAITDTIQFAVAGLKGKTMIIHSPAEFAKAIDQLERGVVARQ